MGRCPLITRQVGTVKCTTHGARNAATIEIVIITGHKKLSAIPRSIFNEVTTNVNLLTRARSKLYRTVIPNGRFDKTILSALKTIRLSRTVNATTITGYTHLITTVGLITTFIDIKKTVLNKLPIGVISPLTPLVLIALVKTDFTTKVLNVVENLIPVVIIITLKYNVSEITSNALPVTYPWECPKNAGTTQTFIINYNTRKNNNPVTSHITLSFLKPRSIVTASNTITKITVNTLLNTKTSRIKLVNCRRSNFKLLKVPQTTAAEDTVNTFFKHR